MSNEYVINITECYLPLKKNAIMKYVGEWMDLENIISEVTQSQKHKKIPCFFSMRNIAYIYIY